MARYEVEVQANLTIAVEALGETEALALAEAAAFEIDGVQSSQAIGAICLDPDEEDEEDPLGGGFGVGSADDGFGGDEVETDDL